VVKSNGKRISKFQIRLHEKLSNEFPDAILEKYLEDVHLSVDIYIPSIKKVIECYGDYWHCNPKKCLPDYYNKSLHMTAQEVWNKDKTKIEKLTLAGYSTEIVWENSNKKLAHSIKK
jgi:G:T-mismatch repair DNA endonuclease (very short patch repair protein)